MSEVDIRKRVGSNFKRIRSNLGLTQAQAAEVGNVDVSYIGQIETGRSSFGGEAIKKWAAIFNVDMVEFFVPERVSSVFGQRAAGGSTSYHAEHMIHELTEDEHELLEHYRKVSEKGKGHILDTAKLLKE